MLPILLTLLPVATVSAALVPQDDIPTLRVDLPTPGASQVWQPICIGPSMGTLAELEHAVRVHEAMLEHPTQVIDSGSERPGGFNIVFVGSGLPAAAVTALTACETYLESFFSDPITVTIQVSFQTLDKKYLGYTSSSRVTALYTTARPMVVADMDGNDTIQVFLPTGPAFLVNYFWFASTFVLPFTPGLVTIPLVRAGNEDRVVFHFANWKAVGGIVAGGDAAITFNSTLPFDYDPSNGVGPTDYSFRDVVIHEATHALGFSSAGDALPDFDVKMLDMFRFLRSDGLGDANPDTLAEFQTRSRHVVKGLPDDDHISDLITVEYRMSDGDPKQMSHFRKQTPRIGMMDPSLGKGVTYHPNYFTAADLNMLDAIGYDL
jgi:hypothetical protein